MKQFLRGSLRLGVKIGLSVKGSLPKQRNAWSPNYNGVNSYIDIPQWSAINYAVEFTLYRPTPDTVGYILCEDDSSDRRISLWDNGGTVKLLIGKSTYIDVDSSKLCTKFRIQSDGKVYQDDVLKASTVVPSSFITDRIGAKGDRVSSSIPPIKGQIYNLKLIDNIDPDNSRSYPGVIHSYVDPSATDVPMPDSTVLIDELGDGDTNGTMYNFGAAQPYVPLLGDRQAYLGNRSASGYVRGVSKTSFSSYRDPNTTKPVEGSWTNALPPINSLLISDSGIKVKVTGHLNNSSYTVHYSVVTGTTEQVKVAFQYPNAFKIIKPTDPDYGDYQ
ncbi:hypothetical protein [Endozoicomonas sp. ALD040]|uniref:hypothetical protein n=1 Tax=Endozoicomonas sp. ALD040 TaxID=3403079 RepID=UPI003BAEA71C